MTLNEYLAKIAAEKGITYDESKAIRFITDKARAIKDGNCAVVSDETVGLWFREYLEKPEEPDEKPAKSEPVKEVKTDDRQISIFDI